MGPLIASWAPRTSHRLRLLNNYLWSWRRRRRFSRYEQDRCSWIWRSSRQSRCVSNRLIFINRDSWLVNQPKDLVRQSIPFSYLYSTVISADSSVHSISIYSDIVSGKFYHSIPDFESQSDINTDWITGSTSLPVISNGVVENDIVILSSRLQVPQAFTTVNGCAYDGTIYYASLMVRHRLSFSWLRYIIICIDEQFQLDLPGWHRCSKFHNELIWTAEYRSIACS